MYIYLIYIYICIYMYIFIYITLFAHVTPQVEAEAVDIETLILVTQSEVPLWLDHMTLQDICVQGQITLTIVVPFS